ncbi:MAG: hypothetical protein LBU39_09425 [Desulfobulbaceae bacterium]|jgi:hypothetical protein|nr:hypothetical protein [Desulfobulbaceae bacterium]
MKKEFPAIFIVPNSGLAWRWLSSRQTNTYRRHPTASGKALGGEKNVLTKWSNPRSNDENFQK